MRVLVAVASRHGGTWDIGYRIAAELAALGHPTDVVGPEDVVTVEPYDAVVLGSAVYTGHWLPSAHAFGRRFAPDLRTRPVWLFSSGLATAPATAANHPWEIRALANRIGARGHRAFGGRLDLALLDRRERAIIAVARGREGDHRDLEAVGAWAVGIGTEPARAGELTPA